MFVPTHKERLLRDEHVNLDEVAALPAAGIHFPGSDTTGVVCFADLPRRCRITVGHRHGVPTLPAAAGSRIPALPTLQTRDPCDTGMTEVARRRRRRIRRGAGWGILGRSHRLLQRSDDHRDRALITTLRAACGRPLLEPGSTVVGALVAAGPHRVFGTACGRVEVHAAIPPPEGRSPDGPHTHLLPAVLRPGRTHAPTVSVPADHVPVAHLYPPSPLTDPQGRPRSFRRRAPPGVP